MKSSDFLTKVNELIEIYDPFTSAAGKGVMILKIKVDFKFSPFYR